MSVNGIYSNNISDTYTPNTTTKEKIEKVDKGNAETVEDKQETEIGRASCRERV